MIILIFLFNVNHWMTSLTCLVKNQPWGKDNQKKSVHRNTIVISDVLGVLH